MVWKKRALICKNQIFCNNRFGDAPIGGVRVTNTKGEIEYLNQHPKTDWKAQLVIANNKLKK